MTHAQTLSREDNGVTMTTTAEWSAGLGRARSHALSHEQKLLRTELGLPTNGPIVTSGHQASLWHPGIAAKLFALRALAKATGAMPAWLVVDTDEGDVTALRLPLAVADGRVFGEGAAGGTSANDAVKASPGVLRAKAFALANGGARWANVPSAMREATALAVPASAMSEAHDAVKERLAAFGKLLVQENSRGHASLARLLTSVMQQTEGLREAFEGVHIVYTSEISRTTQFAALRTALMTGSSQETNAITSYNQAVRMHPAARMRELVLDAKQRELPFWWLAPLMPRVAAKASLHNEPGPSDELRALPPDEDREWNLYPRALITTMLMRQYACELFIHGLGGGVYDQVLTSWLSISRAQRDGLSQLAGELCPAIVVSGTKRLALTSSTDAAQMHAWAQAATKAHRAAHDPSLVGDADAGRAKRELAEAISRMGKSPQKQQQFRAMHALLARVREQRSESLAALRAEQTFARERMAGVSVALDRTFSCVLHAPRSLGELERAVALRVATELGSEGGA